MTQKAKSKPAQEGKKGMTLEEAIAQEAANYVRLHEDRLKRLRERAEGTHLARQLLSGAGFAVKPPTWSSDFTYLALKVDRADLTSVRHALGCPLRFTGSEIESERDGTVRWSFQPRDFGSVLVYCVVPLTETSRCKIVKELRSVLVCGKE